MKNFNNKFTKTLGLLTLCWVVSFSVMAQTQGRIKPVGDPAEYSTCIPVSWHNTNTPIPYKLDGIDPDKTNSYHWYVSGDLKINSISADSLTVYVSSASSNPNSRGKDFGKGRIWVTYWEETISTICGNPRVYYDVYKSFTDTDTKIAGNSDCISEGDTVTYSIDAMVSQNINSMIGIDSYYWDFSAGLVEEILYYSGDSSSVTFIAGALTGNDTIFVDMGRCNLTDDFRYTTKLGQAVEDPIFVAGFEPPTCLPFYVEQDTIILIAQDNVTYSWDCGSWEKHTSAIGDTLIYKPSSNAQEISLTASGPCEDNDYDYQINRVLSSNDIIVSNALSDTCQVSNSFVEFSVAGVPEGTIMEWSVSGTGWSIPASEVNSTSPTVRVGTEPGTLSVRTQSCDYTISRTIYIQPNTPEAITGASCLTLNDTANKTYEIASVANADSYEWIYPSGWSVVGSDTGSSITLTPSGTNAGIIQVRAKGCSNSDWSSKTLLMNGIKPTIQASKTCLNSGISDHVVFSVTPISGETYEWDLDSNLGNITSYSGTGNSQIQVSTLGNDGTFYIKARAITGSACGASEWGTFSFTISGLDMNILEKSSRPAYYEIEPIGWDLRDHNFSWTLDGIDVTYTSAQYSTTDIEQGLRSASSTHDFYVIVTPVSGCVTKKTIGGPDGDIVVEDNLKSAKSALSDTNSTRISESNMMVYPNPVSSKLTVSFSERGKADIRITDMRGSVVKILKSKSRETEFDLSDLQSGSYIILASQNDNMYRKTIVVQK